MENIDIFDKYIRGELSEKERLEFNEQLKNNADFALDFKIYSSAIVGICREGEQNDKDFELAMKTLSEEKLREIIGVQEKRQMPKTVVKKKIIRPWMWQASSFAAIIIIAVISVLKVQRDARYAVDDALIASANLNVMASRSGEAPIDIRDLSDSQLKEKLPDIIETYKNSTELEDIADNGFILAMTYIRLHDREKAATTLKEMISKLEPYGFANDIAQWKSILNIIE